MADHLNKRLTKLEEKVRHLEASYAPRQEDPHSPRPPDNPEHHSEATPRQPARSNDGTHNRANTSDQSHNNSRPWWIRMWVWKPWKRGLYIVVGIAAIGYAIVTYRLWIDSNRNFRVDQRPWMKVELVPDAEASNKVTTTVTVGQYLVIPVRIKNIGKTPALDVHGAFAIQIASSTDKLFLPPDMTNPPRVEHPSHWVGIVNVKSGTIFPDQFHDLPIAKSGGCATGDCGPIPITQPELDQLTKDGALIYIEGTVSYTDGFGANHWTRFCTTMPPNPRTEQGACVEYNRADSEY